MVTIRASNGAAAASTGAAAARGERRRWTDGAGAGDGDHARGAALDFASALYLGLWHPAWSLAPWTRLTTGVPAALREPPISRVIADTVAGLVGAERALVAPSTLHVFWDLFPALADRRTTILVDGGVYPVGRWGAERAAARGVPVHSFPHHDAAALAQAAARAAGRGRRPVVVADGFCPGCGRAAPLGAYVAIARRWEGRLVIDDTQALGILGREPGRCRPYGVGGGGTAPHLGVSGPDVVTIASLAKGLGVPLAVLAGGSATVAGFEAASATRTHCSPPAAPTLRAAAHALAVNARHGERLRARLAVVARHFRRRCADAGLAFTGGLFPVQTLRRVDPGGARRLQAALARAGIATVLRQAHGGLGPVLTVVLTARHTRGAVDRLVETLTRDVS